MTLLDKGRSPFDSTDDTARCREDPVLLGIGIVHVDIGRTLAVPHLDGVFRIAENPARERRQNFECVIGGCEAYFGAIGAILIDVGSVVGRPVVDSDNPSHENLAHAFGQQLVVIQSQAAFIDTRRSAALHRTGDAADGVVTELRLQIDRHIAGIGQIREHGSGIGEPDDTAKTQIRPFDAFDTADRDAAAVGRRRIGNRLCLAERTVNAADRGERNRTADTDLSFVRVARERLGSISYESANAAGIDGTRIGSLIDRTPVRAVDDAALALADHAAQMLLIDDSGIFGVELALILGSNRGFGLVGAAADALAAENRSGYTADTRLPVVRRRADVAMVGTTRDRTAVLPRHAADEIRTVGLDFVHSRAVGDDRALVDAVPDYTGAVR